MDRQGNYFEQLNTTRSTSCDSKGASRVEAPDVPVSPVSRALGNLREEIGDLHCNTDSLISQLAPALCSETPTSAENQCRPSMASDLAEQIQLMADSLRIARIKLVSARDRLTI